MDADQLGTLHHLAQGIMMDTNGQAMDAIREVGPGGHYLGCNTPRRTSNRPSGARTFWTTNRSRPGPKKAHATRSRWPTERVRKQLADYQAPDLDPGTREALETYVAKRKSEMPDAFI